MCYKSKVLLITASVFTKYTFSHMMMNHASVWGYFDASMETPLNMNTQDWRCHGKQKGYEPAFEMEAGGSISFKVTCSEAGAEGNGGNCANDPNALHKGGGCAISIDYSGTGKNFKTISIASECPSSSYNPIEFKLPADMPPCENCACAWTWVPPSIGAADESYMNCFTCSVKSSVTGSDIEAPATEFYFVPGGSMPQNGKRTYNDRYPNGAIADVKAIGTGAIGYSYENSNSTTSTIASPVTTSTTETFHYSQSSTLATSTKSNSPTSGTSNHHGHGYIAKKKKCKSK